MARLLDTHVQGDITLDGDIDGVSLYEFYQDYLEHRHDPLYVNVTGDTMSGDLDMNDDSKVTFDSNFNTRWQVYGDADSNEFRINVNNTGQNELILTSDGVDGTNATLSIGGNRMASRDWSNENLINENGDTMTGPLNFDVSDSDEIAFRGESVDNIIRYDGNQLRFYGGNGSHTIMELNQDSSIDIFGSLSISDSITGETTFSNQNISDGERFMRFKAHRNYSLRRIGSHISSANLALSMDVGGNDFEIYSEENSQTVTLFDQDGSVTIPNGNLDMGDNIIYSLSDPSNDDHALNRGYADSRYVNEGGDTMTGRLQAPTLNTGRLDVSSGGEYMIVSKDNHYFGSNNEGYRFTKVDQNGINTEGGFVFEEADDEDRANNQPLLKIRQRSGVEVENTNLVVHEKLDIAPNGAGFRILNETQSNTASFIPRDRNGNLQTSKQFRYEPTNGYWNLTSDLFMDNNVIKNIHRLDSENGAIRFRGTGANGSDTRIRPGNSIDDKTTIADGRDGSQRDIVEFPNNPNKPVYLTANLEMEGDNSNWFRVPLHSGGDGNFPNRALFVSSVDNVIIFKGKDGQLYDIEMTPR